MNNYIIVIIIIIILFIFSGDKDIINKLINYKSVILLLIVYFMYNNLNLILLLIALIGIILSNEKIRKIIYTRYEKYINLGKNNIKNFLNLEPEQKSPSELLEKLVEENIIEHKQEQNINEPEEDSEPEELQKLIDEINIS